MVGRLSRTEEETCTYVIDYEPAEGKYQVQETVETHRDGHHVFTHERAALQIVRPHPYEPGTTVRKWVPWNRVRYVECIEYIPPGA